MFIPIWLLVLVVLFLSLTISYCRKLFKKWKVVAVNNYRRWGKMKYEFECVADFLILDRDHLCENLCPELREELAQHFRVKWLNNPTHWNKLSRREQLFGPYSEYVGIRKIIYQHFQDYNYRDVDSVLTTYGVYMGSFSKDEK
ncbi:hypothetical protein ACVCDB_000183 [Enterobacter hormaechei]|nr:hypothetical protein [Enterobacter hormaechei]ELX7458600.1 hypothetical protein [Enterobacter hormaechei subsp. hoffmannii]MBH4409829.1 hypothetical protein [Pseudomonas aeruginosa]EHN8717685.1 hypothetical protein [Enterobacter hormaechei]EJV4646893.1 hypothetical protein [Enterobacter hormaechei]ELC6310081.1 hypothetical protein [Enterobacter hormaechei]